jgi:hypothetical protein
MKKFLIIFCSLMLGMGSFAFTQKAIDDKLLQTFKTSFPNAEEVNWFESKETNIVSFKENGVRTRAVYKRNNQLQTLTRSYNETNLPYPIQFKIKQYYPDKKIYGVIEMTTNDENLSITEYNIKLEDEKNWYTVQMDRDGGMTIVEKFKKSAAK